MNKSRLTFNHKTNDIYESIIIDNISLHSIIIEESKNRSYYELKINQIGEWINDQDIIKIGEIAKKITIHIKPEHQILIGMGIGYQAQEDYLIPITNKIIQECKRHNWAFSKFLEDYYHNYISTTNENELLIEIMIMIGMLQIHH